MINFRLNNLIEKLNFSEIVLKDNIILIIKIEDIYLYIYIDTKTYPYLSILSILIYIISYIS